MGGAKGDQNSTNANTNNTKSNANETDLYPEGTRLGHYVLGKHKNF